ncbi:hypothetical protein F4804DRAFT_338681 [Jackrogersella minutella]|nr:hypothetical protein F4804DRAFT_338681 [Jackrogersella minutella]
MSTGGTGGDPIWGLRHGVTNAQQNVELSDDPDPKGTAAGYVHDQRQGKSFLGNLKEALKPGDTKRHSQPHMGDFTYDGRHGGFGETMMRGHRDRRDRRESEDSGQSHRRVVRTGESVTPGRKDHRNEEWGGIIGTMKSAADNVSEIPRALKKVAGRRKSDAVEQSTGSCDDSGLRDNSGVTGKTKRSSGFPATDSVVGHQSGEDEDEDEASRVSAFDSRGSVRHHFSSDGAIGGKVHKLGGPFSKEGVIGRKFSDKGSAGGQV